MNMLIVNVNVKVIDNMNDLTKKFFDLLNKDELTQAAYELKSVVSNVFRDIRYKNVERILLKKTNCLDWAV